MRIVFFGSGAFGLPTLEHLHDKHDVVMVVSQPDKPAGRKRKLTPTPVAQWAIDHGLPLERVEDVNTPEFIRRCRDAQPDASVVIAFGQKLSPELIDAMGRLAVNLHASILPGYRGAAPINHAMIDNQPTTGVSVIALAQKMDAGDIYAKAATPIKPDETAGELHDRLARLGPMAIGQTLHGLANERLAPEPQDHDRATLAPKLSKADGFVDFTQPAAKARARIHGLTPWPGVAAQHVLADGTEADRLLLRRVADLDINHGQPPGTVLADACIACGEGTAIRLVEVQPPGKRTMPIADYLRGNALPVGSTFRSPA